MKSLAMQDEEEDSILSQRLSEFLSHVTQLQLDHFVIVHEERPRVLDYMETYTTVTHCMLITSHYPAKEKSKFGHLLTNVGLEILGRLYREV